MASRPEGWHELPDSILLKVCALVTPCMRLPIQYMMNGWTSIISLQIMNVLDHASVASTCALVCKSWLRVSRDKLLWRAILARDFGKTERSLREAAGTEVSWISGKTQNGYLNQAITDK